MFIYIRDNEWLKSRNVYKVGITTDIINRNSTYITGEVIRGSFVKIIELLDIDKNELIIIDKKIKDEFKEFNIYLNGGKEFYKREIFDNYIEKYLIKNNYKFILKNENEIEKINNYDKNNKELRDYQKEAINYLKEELLNNYRCYLYLATGAGKSLISINVIKELKPLNIIIFSPRTIIKKQNINEENLKILNNYKIYRKDDINVNDNNNDNKNLIISVCIQSFKNVYELIIKNDIRNIFIWFDEAHWGLDEWVSETNDEIKQFFINDTNYIKYRLFTSASPNKEFIIDNYKFYGKLYEPIKFKELQLRGFLTNINVEIFDKEIDKEEIKFNNLVFNTFNKKGEERRLGFSFHNSCESATKFYQEHLKEFNKDNIDIKPYLLISNYNGLNLNENNVKIEEFENEIKKKQKAIAYVVAKFSMGYDNRNIDIIYFTDPKLSYKDIIQSIGRGTRTNDHYKDKKLRIVLPTNRENEVGYDYKKIENVLKYLLIEIELEPEKIKSYKLNDNSKINNKISINSNCINPNDNDNEISIEEDLDENSNINTIKFSIISKLNDWTLNKIIRQMKINNIHNIKDYEDYSKNNKNLNLPDIKTLLNTKDFNFKDTYRNENECPYYYNKNDCLEVIKNYKKELRKITIDNKKLKYLNEKDNKIPNMSLWYFYGGCKEEYY